MKQETRQLHGQRWFYFWVSEAWLMLHQRSLGSICHTAKGKGTLSGDRSCLSPCATGDREQLLEFRQNLWTWVTSWLIENHRFFSAFSDTSPSGLKWSKKIYHRAQVRLAAWHWSCCTQGGFSPVFRSCRMSIPPPLLPYGLRVSWKEMLFIKQPGKQFRPHAQNLLFSVHLPLKTDYSV